MQFGTDGVRGVAYVELTPAFAERLARAAAVVLGHGSDTVVIGGDTRESTPDIEEALAEGFASQGLDVIRLGVVPTPVVAFEARRRGALGAVVSASHNPFQDNGIKLFAAGGTKLADDVETLIEEALDALEDAPASRRLGEITDEAGHSEYVDHVVAILEGRNLAGLRIVVDAANGAASAIAPEVLRACGAEVITINDRPDGRNINDGCGATYPQVVSAAVIAHDADLGVALDGDADRVIAVAADGSIVDGDHILAIVAVDLRARQQLRRDTVVVTVMTNLGFRLAMSKANIEVVETAVGDRYVLEALAAGGFSLGGEQSGHVIFTDHATTGDGVLTAVVLADILSRSSRTFSEIASAAMTSLPQVLVNVRVGRTAPHVATDLAGEIAAATAALGSTGRVLVRASGTEPMVRVMVEAETAERAQQCADDLAAIVQRTYS